VPKTIFSAVNDVLISLTKGFYSSINVSVYFEDYNNIIGCPK